MAKVRSKEIKISDIENLLEKDEAKKDYVILSELQSKLPSAARVKIFKRGEDGNRGFIQKLSAEDFKKADFHDYIKKKFVPVYGGGDYIIELLDGKDNVVHTSEITVLGEPEKKEAIEIDRLKEHEQIMKMREDAFEKLKEAQEEKLKVEKQKWENVVDLLRNQYQRTEEFFKSQIQELRERLKQQDSEFIRDKIAELEKKLTEEKLRYEREIAEAKRNAESADRFYNTIGQIFNQILPEILKKGEDPVEKYEKFLGIINNVVQNKKDFVETLLEDPRKVEIFKKLIVGEEKKSVVEEIFKEPRKIKDWLEILGLTKRKDSITEILENADKLKAILEMLGFAKRKDSITEILENADKFKTILEMLGFTKRKDFLEELMESEKKFEILQKLSGSDDIKQTLTQMINELRNLRQSMNEANVSEAEEPKSELRKITDTLKDLKEIMHYIDPKAFPKTENVILSFLEKITPIVSEGIKNWRDVMIATQMIRRGFIPVTTSNPRTKRAETVFVPVGATMGTTAGATAEATMGTTMGTAGYAGMNQTEVNTLESAVNQFVNQLNQQTIQKEYQKAARKIKSAPKRTKKRINIEKLMEDFIENTSSEWLTEEGTLDEEAFIESAVNGTIEFIENNPQIAEKIYQKYNEEGLKNLGIKVALKFFEIEKDKIEEIINRIIEKVKATLRGE